MSNTYAIEVGTKPKVSTIDVTRNAQRDLDGVLHVFLSLDTRTPCNTMVWHLTPAEARKLRDAITAALEDE